MTSALGIWKIKTNTLVLASEAWLFSVAYRGSIDKNQWFTFFTTEGNKRIMPKSFLLVITLRKIFQGKKVLEEKWELMCLYKFTKLRSFIYFSF